MADLTANLMGDPAPGRSALSNREPWQPNYDDQPVATGARPTKRSGEDRRFTNKADLDPAAVRSLPLDHPALLENRTLFPSTVVDVDENFSGRLLVSGKNNRKLGECIAKGKFKGYALYGLSLEERATCPSDCSVRAFCYGNGMQLARRHRILDTGLFCTFLEDEIREILADPIAGLMVRLHVLGDFPSVEYVAFWSEMLAEYPQLACYGYTHRRIKKHDGDEIGDAIDALKHQYSDRFRIRWSGQALADGAVVINEVPTTKRVEAGLVCPAQTDATACCASCGLCWEGHARNDAIVFIKHGPKSLEALALTAKANPVATATKESAPVAASTTVEGVRPVVAIRFAPKRDAVLATRPEFRLVRPTDLKVEPKYQRDLSSKSMRLIRKIVTGWDWAKFKPPICAESDDGLVVIDGQHTAIAAASHPEIAEIPVMIVPAVHLERRAEAFVSHNRDRLTMTAAQIFYGDVAAGNADAIATLESIKRGGGEVPRLPINKNYAKPGQITAIAELRKIHSASGSQLVERIVRIATLSRVKPITTTVVCSLRIIMTEKHFAPICALTDTQLSAAVAQVKNIEATSQHYAAETGQSRFRAAASLIANAAQESGVAA